MAEKAIIAALKETKSAVTQIAVFTSLIDTLVVFLTSILALILTALPWWPALIIAIAYGSIRTARMVKRYQNPALVEEKVPELSEQLTTVADNLDKENLLVLSLQQDVLHKMRAIKTSYFLSFGRLARELITLTVTAILIITAAAYQVQFLDVKNMLKDLGELGEGPKGPYELAGEGLEFIENISEDIYGNKSIAELGADELQLQLTPVLSDIDIGKVKPPEEREFTSTMPTEIKATTDVSFQETIPKGYQRIVKSYFREIAKTS